MNRTEYVIVSEQVVQAQSLDRGANPSNSGRISAKLDLG